jgi:simple sugar transport system ATP-binding protein
VGENGAGKSTLINIFTGRIRPDSGAATLDGIALRAGSAQAALRAAIAAVYQSPMLFERMSWEENLALGGPDGASGRLDLGATARRAHELAASLGFELPPRGALIEGCSMAARVRLEIIRALSTNPRVLILDEPTGLLGPAELAAFLDLLRHLRGQRRIVVIVTHKLAEALAVADRVTVLRHGRNVAERLVNETSAAELAHLMVGEIPPSSPAPEKSADGAPVLAIENLSLVSEGRAILDNVCLTIHEGEIAGIAGVDGNGQAELVEILAGIRAPSCGRVRLCESEDRERGGAIAVIAQNRDRDGLILDMALWENILLSRPLRERFSGRCGWLKRARAFEFCGELIERFRIRAPGVEALAAALSGGNRQRLAVARALAAHPRAIVAHDICRGLDPRAAAEVQRMLLDYAAAGGAVLLVSGDLDELLTLCGRLAVISRGRLTEDPAAARDPVRIGLLMSGAVR